jgi:hypothetical protein
MGLVTVMYGSPTGLDPTHVDALHLGNIVAPPAANTHFSMFGSGVAAGDVDDDGFDDLAVASGGEGRVDLFTGSPAGLDRAAVSTTFHSGPRLPLGGMLWMAHLDSAPGADLASAIPGAQLPAPDGSPLDWAGMVRVFSGGSDGFSSDRSVTVHQGMPGVAGVPEEADMFGSSLPGVE